MKFYGKVTLHIAVLFAVTFMKSFNHDLSGPPYCIVWGAVVLYGPPPPHKLVIVCKAV